MAHSFCHVGGCVGLPVFFCRVFCCLVSPDRVGFSAGGAHSYREVSQFISPLSAGLRVVSTGVLGRSLLSFFLLFCSFVGEFPPRLFLSNPYSLLWRPKVVFAVG